MSAINRVPGYLSIVPDIVPDKVPDDVGARFIAPGTKIDVSKKVDLKGGRTLADLVGPESFEVGGPYSQNYAQCPEVVQARGLALAVLAAAMGLNKPDGGDKASTPDDSPPQGSPLV